jgi:phosphohistidine phosphatase
VVFCRGDLRDRDLVVTEARYNAGMLLALIRHAIAEDGDDDFARPLSTKGKKRFREVVRGLESLGLSFTRVVHSPTLRALETAELLAPITEGLLEATRLLAVAPSPELLALLSGGPVALVGHEPHLSALVAWLTCGSTERASAFTMKKGAVALLEGTPTPGGMSLVALIPPRLFRRAG